jgi:hypothetical protein
MEVNSALLAVIRCAFPERKVLFLAEEQHLEQVRQNAITSQLSNVDYKAIDIPPRYSSSLSRQSAEYQLCKMVFELAVQNRTGKVLFCSITSPGLIAIKMLLRTFNQIRAIVIPHSILEKVIRRPSLRIGEMFFWFRVPMLFANTDQIHYLVLGPSIKEQLCQLFPRLKPYVGAIDHPYNFKYPDNCTSSLNDTITFGSFGVGHRGKGTEMLFNLAEEVREMRTEYQSKFVLIGPIIDKRISARQSDAVNVPSANKLMSRCDYDYYAKTIHYSLFFYKPTSYRLTASGALFDAFSYVKPIIAIRNPFFEYYFKIMGDIGYLCDNYDQVKTIIIDILNNKVSDHYQLQQQNILKGREQFNIHKIAQNVVEMWD